MSWINLGKLKNKILGKTFLIHISLFYFVNRTLVLHFI